MTPLHIQMLQGLRRRRLLLARRRILKRASNIFRTTKTIKRRRRAFRQSYHGLDPRFLQHPNVPKSYGKPRENQISSLVMV
jgi:hypothetical protein